MNRRGSSQHHIDTRVSPQNRSPPVSSDHLELVGDMLSACIHIGQQLAERLLVINAGGAGCPNQSCSELGALGGIPPPIET